MLTQDGVKHELYGLRICGGAYGQFESPVMGLIDESEHARANGCVSVGDEFFVQKGLLGVQVVDEGVSLLAYGGVVGRVGVWPAVVVKVPAHLLLAAANGVLELFVELGGPLEGEVLLEPALVVAYAVQLLALDDDAVAVEDERLARGGGERADDGGGGRGADVVVFALRSGCGGEEGRGETGNEGHSWGGGGGVGWRRGGRTKEGGRAYGGVYAGGGGRSSGRTRRNLAKAHWTGARHVELRMN